MKKKFNIFIGPAILLLIWFLISKFNVIDTFFLPDPLETLKELVEISFKGTILDDLLITLWRVFVAFIISLITGLPVGLILGSHERIYKSLEFIIDFFRSTPSTAIFPLFLLIFGISDISKIAVAIFASSLILIFNTAYGAMHARKSRILAAKIMGANRFQIFKWILFQESLPQTFIGLRSAVSLSLVVVIVTEMFIGTSAGLGKLIIDSQITYDIRRMYAVILLCGIIGYILNLLFIIMDKKLLHWHKA